MRTKTSCVRGFRMCKGAFSWACACACSGVSSSMRASFALILPQRRCRRQRRLRILVPQLNERAVATLCCDGPCPYNRSFQLDQPRLDVLRLALAQQVQRYLVADLVRLQGVEQVVGLADRLVVQAD